MYGKEIKFGQKKRGRRSTELDWKELPCFSYFCLRHLKTTPLIPLPQIVLFIPQPPANHPSINLIKEKNYTYIVPQEWAQQTGDKVPSKHSSVPHKFPLVLKSLTSRTVPGKQQAHQTTITMTAWGLQQNQSQSQDRWNKDPNVLEDPNV